MLISQEEKIFLAFDQTSEAFSYQIFVPTTGKVHLSCFGKNQLLKRYDDGSFCNGSLKFFHYDCPENSFQIKISQTGRLSVEELLEL